MLETYPMIAYGEVAVAKLRDGNTSNVSWSAVVSQSLRMYGARAAECTVRIVYRVARSRKQL